MNEMNLKIRAVEAAVRDRVENDTTGHDWDHALRVANLARDLTGVVGADRDIAYLGGLCHDVADHKFHGGDRTVGPRVAREILEAADIPAAMTDEVVEIVGTVSWSGGKVPPTLAGKCVQDADRLDALGAIGIVRCFQYAGATGGSVASAVAHFDEKLLLLPDHMHTDVGRREAMTRALRMRRFLWELAVETKGPLV